MHGLLRSLKGRGVSILYISHRLDEVVELVDSFTVLKDGRVVSASGETRLDVNEIVSRMIGSDIEEHFPKERNATAEVVLEAIGVATAHRVKDATFDVRRGEVVGLGGVIGSGRTEIARALFGADRIVAGELRVNGKRAKFRSPTDAIRAGIALVPENRKSDGLFFNFAAGPNITMAKLKDVTRGPLFDHRREGTVCGTYVRDLEITPLAQHKPVNLISGGNQQKVLIARWLFSQSQSDHSRRTDTGHRRRRETRRLPVDERTHQGREIHHPDQLRAQRTDRHERPDRDRQARSHHRYQAGGRRDARGPGQCRGNSRPRTRHHHAQLRGVRMKRSSFAEFAGPFAALLIILIVVALTTPNFIAIDNFQNIAMQAAVLSIVAIGSTVVILTGGIDLSPGSMIALITMVLASLIKLDGFSLVVAIPVALLCGALLGAVNGFFVAYLKIPSFIVTLAALSVFKGIALTIGGGTPIVSLSPNLEAIFYGQILGIPLPFIYVVVLYTAAVIVLNHTVFGREIYAIGGNEVAARLSGIRIRRIRLLAFIIAGGCAAIGAVLLSARLNSGSPNYGTLIELQAIAAVVVGGASLSGGRGHVFNTLIGVLIITVVQNGLNLNAVSPAVQSIAIGLIILLAVAIDIWRGQLTRDLLTKVFKRPALATSH